LLHPEINLYYLPSYSPNLNLIERLWKHVKGEALNSSYLDQFEDFKNKIDECISNTDKKDYELVKKLISGKFQMFDEEVAIVNNKVA
jgi:transposase